MKVLRKAFKQELDASVSAFVNSIDADAKLIQSDIQGSLAHASMLGQTGLITAEEAASISAGLTELAQEYASGDLQLKPELEDVHMNVEKQLETKIGSAAARLHTGRSRNDQVALDTRLFTAEKIQQINKQIANLQIQLLNTAIKNIDAVMPGYTHLQRAQPILFAHAMHAFAEMLERDSARFNDCLKRTCVSPLGAAALAGSSLPIDPTISVEVLQSILNSNTTQESNHSSIDENSQWGLFENSLDAVSDRDFAVEFLSAACISATHLSQVAETLIIWASAEFGFISFKDNVTTASSLMPNKKNPDPVELIRGKTGAIVGNLVNALVTLKALPLGYNRDLQEIKPTIINSADTLSASLNVLSIVIDSMMVNGEKMYEAAKDPFLAATDIAEYLVKKGVPFRTSHETTSALVAHARECGKSLDELGLKEYQNFAKEFDFDIYELFYPKLSVANKVSHGSTGSASVQSAVKNALQKIQSKFGSHTNS